MADFSMSDMPWLGQPADPAGSLARGVQAGSMIAQNRLQRASLAQRKFEYEQDYKLREAVASENSALAVLDATLKSQDLQMRELKLKDFLEQRQAAIEDEKAVQTAWDWAGKEMEKGNLLGALDVWHDFAASHQRMLENPKFMALRKELTDRLDLETERQKIKSTMGSSFTPRFGIATSPLTRKQYEYFQESPNKAQLMDENQKSAQSGIGKLYADRDAARKAGRIEEAAAIDKQIMLDQAAASTYAGLTPANQTRAQQGLADSLETIDIANRLEPLISSETIGVRAFAESILKDRILAQFFEGMESPERATAETLAANLRARVLSSLKSDSNIAEPERKQILKAIPEINDPVDSPARAKRLIRTASKLAAIQAVVKAGKLGEPMPKAAAQILDGSELKRLVDTGVITREQALAIFDAR